MSLAVCDVVRRESQKECTVRNVPVRPPAVDEYRNIACAGRLHFDAVPVTETEADGTEDIHEDEVGLRIRENDDAVVRSPRNVDGVDYRYNSVVLTRGDIRRCNYCRDNPQRRNVNKRKGCCVKWTVGTVKRRTVCCGKSMAGFGNRRNAYCDLSMGESVRNWNDCCAMWKAGNCHATSTAAVARRDVVETLDWVVEGPVSSNPAAAGEVVTSTDSHSDSHHRLCSAIPVTAPPSVAQAPAEEPPSNRSFQRISPLHSAL